MSELTPQARAFLERHATTGQPAAEDRARVKAALGATLARPAALQVLPGTRPEVAPERWRPRLWLAAAAVLITASAYYWVGRQRAAARQEPPLRSEASALDAGALLSPVLVGEPAPPPPPPELRPAAPWLKEELAKGAADPLLASALARYADGDLDGARVSLEELVAAQRAPAVQAEAAARLRDLGALQHAFRVGRQALDEGRPERAEEPLRLALELDARLVLGPALIRLPVQERRVLLARRESPIRHTITTGMADHCYARGKHFADRKDFRQACKVWKLGFSFSKGHNELLKALTNVCTKRAKDVFDGAESCAQLRSALDFAVDGDGYREQIVAQAAAQGCPTAMQSEGLPPVPRGPTEETFLVRQSYARGDRDEALAAAAACVDRLEQCRALLAELLEADRLWKTADSSDTAALNRLVELDERLAGPELSLPARQLAPRVTPSLLARAQRAVDRGDHAAALPDLLLAGRLTGGKNADAMRLLLELRHRAKDLYLRGYQLKDTDADEAARLFRQVQELTATDDEYHQKATARLGELERP